VSLTAESARVGNRPKDFNASFRNFLGDGSTSGGDAGARNKGRNMRTTSSNVLRVGHPCWALVRESYLLGAFGVAVVADLAMLIRSIANHFAFGRNCALVTLPFILFVFAVVFRHPSRLWRVVRVTPTELQLPDPKWRHVPLNDIAGVALTWQPGATRSNILGVSTGPGVTGITTRRGYGMWSPYFWRSDGSHVTIGGMGFSTEQEDPWRSKPADAVVEIYQRVAAAQGPDGALSKQISAIGGPEHTWDPGEVLGLRPPKSQWTT
jgi:hypothetical protein